MERDEEQARNTSRTLRSTGQGMAGDGKAEEGKSGKECGSGVRQNLNPFNGDKSPSARALLRHASRQFVRVYPTYPDISTVRPEVARVANHPPTFLTSLAYLLCPFSLTWRSVPRFFDFLHFFLLFRPFCHPLFYPC